MDEQEKEIRDRLAKQLGTEFCSEDDLTKEIDEAEKEITTRREQQISVGEIIEQCNRAVQKMSKKNPHRFLFYLCATALRQMSDRLAQYEQVRH